MERMSGIDALMIYVDRAEAYNHTIKISIIDPAADPEGWSWKRFKAAWSTRVAQRARDPAPPPGSACAPLHVERPEQTLRVFVAAACGELEPLDRRPAVGR